MSEHTPLTEAWAVQYARTYWQYGNEAESQAALTILADALAARTSTATADTGQVCQWAASGQSHTRYCPATADTGLRERVEALADGWDESSAGGHPDCDIDADCVACAAAELRAALDATAAPTTDTGARDE